MLRSMLIRSVSRQQLQTLMVHTPRVPVKLPLSAPETKVTGGLAGGAFLSGGQVELAVGAGTKLVHSLFGVSGTRWRPLQGVHSTAEGNVAQLDGVGV